MLAAVGTPYDGFGGQNLCRAAKTLPGTPRSGVICADLLSSVKSATFAPMPPKVTKMMKNPIQMDNVARQSPTAARGNRRREAERDTEIAAWIAHQVDGAESAPELRLPPPVSA